MERMKKIGTLPLRNAAQVGPSRIGIGFEKLDRKVFEPEKAMVWLPPAAYTTSGFSPAGSARKPKRESTTSQAGRHRGSAHRPGHGALDRPVLRQRAVHPHGEGILRRGGLRAHLHRGRAGGLASLCEGRRDPLPRQGEVVRDLERAGRPVVLENRRKPRGIRRFRAGYGPGHPRGRPGSQGRRGRAVLCESALFQADAGPGCGGGGRRGLLPPL